MVHLVRIAGMLTDALGFSVLPTISQPTFGEVMQELPEAAAFRFTPDPEELKAEIAGRIHSWG
jgi:hypothetical protein